MGAGWGFGRRGSFPRGVAFSRTGRETKLEDPPENGCFFPAVFRCRGLLSIAGTQFQPVRGLLQIAYLKVIPTVARLRKLSACGFHPSFCPLLYVHSRGQKEGWNPQTLATPRGGGDRGAKVCGVLVLLRKVFHKSRNSVCGPGVSSFLSDASAPGRAADNYGVPVVCRLGGGSGTREQIQGAARFLAQAVE